MSQFRLMPRFRWLPLAAICTLAFFLVTGTGCYGKFALTKKLYQFNSKVEDKYARSIVTAVLVIFPAYELSGLADWIILNTLEFWTGRNPITHEVVQSKRSENGETEAIITSRRTREKLETVIESYQHGQLVSTLILWQAPWETSVHAQMVWSDGVVEQYRVYASRWAGYTVQPIVKRTDTSVIPVPHETSYSSIASLDMGNL